MRQLKYSLVFFVIVFLSFSIFANSYKDDLSAGDPDTLKVTLGAEVGLELVATTGEIAGMERACGVAFSFDGNYAYVPAKGKNAPLVWIINISDPANPSVVGTIEIPNPENLAPEAWGVNVAGNHLYIAAYNCGLWIYDITNPAHPVPVGSYHDEKSEGRGLYVSGNYCYVADAWNGLSIYDVSSPSSPQRISQYNTNMDISTKRAEFHDVRVFGNLAYCAAGNHGLVIVDVSDPRNPKGVSFCCDCVSQARYPDGPYDWGRAVEVSGNYAYLGDNNAGLRIVDISQPAHPVEVGVYKVEGGEEIWEKYGGGEVWKIEVVGNYVYIPYDNFDFRAVDISDPLNPAEVGFYPIVGRGKAIGVSDRCAYVIEESSFWVVDIEKPQGRPLTETEYERKIMEIAERYPAISLKAMGKLVEWHIQNERFQQAIEAYEDAIKRFSGVSLSLPTLQRIAEWHIRSGQVEKAEEIYLKAISSHEGTTYALKVKQWLITLYIKSGRENEAKTAFDKLIADFSGHPDLVGAIYEIACQWDDVTAKNGDIENYEKANRIYNDIIQKHPESEFAEKSQWRLRKNLIFSCIDEGKDAEVEKAVDDLIANYSTDPMFGPMIDWIEEKYYNRIYYAPKLPLSEDYWRNPIKTWEKITEKFPDFFFDDPDLYWFIADCYHHLGEYEKAIEYFQKVINNFPNYSEISWARVKIHIIQKVIGLAQQSSSETSEEVSDDYLRRMLPMEPSEEVKEVSKELDEEAMEGEKPHVLELIKGLNKAIPTDDFGWSLGVKRLGDSKDFRAIPVLCEALLKAKRPGVRSECPAAIAVIEGYNKDTSALPALRKALGDSVTDVKFHAALSLIYLGDKSKKVVKQVESILEQLAKGEDMENWTVDWGEYMGLEYMTKTEIEWQQEDFKEGMRKKAIDALGILGTKRAFSILDYLSKYSKDYIAYGDKLISVSRYSKVVAQAARGGTLRCKPYLH